MENLYSLLIPAPVDFTAYDEDILFDSISFGFDESLGGKLNCLLPFFGEKKEKDLKIELQQDSSIESGFYRLDIATAYSTLKFSDDKGLYNGLGTLLQLKFLSKGKINKGFIYDGPRFGYRGFMLDCVRHFFPLSYIKKLLIAAFINHLNVFHWHLTDDQGWRVEIKSHPELCAVNKEFYTQDDIKEIVAFASGLGIEVIPEIECPGHVTALLAARPEFGCTGGPYEVGLKLGVYEDVLCVGNDDVYPFWDDIIGEVASLFSSKYIHIGGDESPSSRWIECPRCRKKMEELSLDVSCDTQWYFTKRITEIVRKHGKTPMGWDEIANPMPNHDIESDIAILLWRGPSAAKAIMENGNPLIICRSDDGAYLDYKQYDDPEAAGWIGINTLEMSYNMALEYPELSGNENIIGGQGNLWTEKIEYPVLASYMLFPRLLALAENFWSDRKDFEDFKKRLANMPSVLDQIGINVSFNLS